MNETLITDIVAQEALDQLEALDRAMDETLAKFKDVGDKLADGLKIQVEVTGDLDKLKQVYETQMQRATQATRQLTQVQQQQQQVIANTTNTISRQLAEQEKLNKVNREAFTQEQNALDMADRILGTHEQNVKAMAKLNKEMDRLKESYKAGTTSAEDFTRRQLELKTAKQELQKILNNETKLMQSAEGSYQQLSLQLERMKMAQKQLNEEEKRSSEGKNLEAEIQKLDAHLKDLAADMGEFQRNVGNYAIAGKSLRTELRELTMQMAQMLADGVDPTSEGFLEIAERAGVLKDAMEDAKSTINDYANDTKGLTNTISVVETAVGGWQVFEGALSAFGMESEEAAAATQKLMGIMSMMQGIQKVSTELTTNGTGAYRAYHAILKLLGLEKAANTAATAADTVATQANVAATGEAAAAEAATATATTAATTASGAHTAAVGVETVALGGATVAATALKVALAALGIGAVIALIAALYETIQQFNAEAEKSAEILEGSTEAMKEGAKATAAQAEEMRYYTGVVENFNGTKEEEKTLVEELNSKYGDAIGYYQNLAQWKNALISIGEDYIYMLELEAVAQAYLNKVAEATVNNDATAAGHYREQFQLYKDKAADMKKIINNRMEIRGVSTSKPSKSTGRSSSKTSTKSTNTDNGAEDAEKEMQELIRESNEMLDEGLEVVTRRLIETESIITEASESAYNKRVDTIRKQYDVLENLIEEHQKADVLAEQEKYDKAKAEAKKYGKDTTQLEEAKWTAVNEVAKKYQRELEDLEQERNATLAAMGADRLALIEKANEEEIAAVQAYNAKRLAKLREGYIEELRQAEGNEQKIQEIKNRYAKETAELTEQNAIDIAHASIMGLEKALEMEDLSAKDRERIAKELAEAKAKLAEATATKEENELDRTVDAEEESRQKRMKAIQDWGQKAGQMISSVSDLFGAMYDNQIAKIEEQMELEQEHHDAEISNIETLAETGVITTEEAELRKREAEQRTAKAQEQLEKKKAALEYKSAMMQKLNNVAQIGIATALGIMQTFAQLGWPAGIPGAAFVAAMGAIQLATALAQPIKAYKEGTKGKPHPGGLAVVGDGGKTELVAFGRHVWLTPDEPTLVDLPRGAEVYPEVTRETVERLGASLPMSIPRDKRNGQPVIINDYSALEGRVATNTKAMGQHLTRLEDTLKKELRRQSFAMYLKSRL